MNPTMASCLDEIIRVTSTFMYNALTSEDFPRAHEVEDYVDNIRAYAQRIESRKDIARNI